MLDNCSHRYLIQETLVKMMQILQAKTTLNLKTLNGERYEPTVEINGLEIAVVKEGETWIKFSRIYTRNHLFVEKEDVATSKKIEDWDYLKAISSKIIQSDDVDWCQLHEGIGNLEDKEQ